eukprot:15467225-Alexandrium_andersonii.AAC.1
MRHLRDACAYSSPDYALRSALGAPRVYNLLPSFVVSATSVNSFQSRLQRLVMDRLRSGCRDWQFSLSWRIALRNHPLRGCCDWHL